MNSEGEEGAVAPIISVIIMVGVTVILASAIGTAFMNISEPPMAIIEVDSV